METVVEGRMRGGEGRMRGGDGGGGESEWTVVEGRVRGGDGSKMS